MKLHVHYVLLQACSTCIYVFSFIHSAQALIKVSMETREHSAIVDNQHPAML